jgi:anthranilate synthase/aminodeoxychorismate synthase-like glutamine amidotransferase
LILLLDNYDSFVYNLARYLEELGQETFVVRNDALTIDETRRLTPAAIVISPGPCTPSEAGVSLELIRQLAGEIPMLGVCLGHQAIAQALGGQIIRAPEPVHGRISPVEHAGTGLFEGVPNPLPATRYHSLIVDETSLPSELWITARTRDGVPMAIEHNSWPLFGVQFHPESILTDSGHSLLANFLRLAGIATQSVPVGDAPLPLHNPLAAEDAWWQAEPL